MSEHWQRKAQRDRKAEAGDSDPDIQSYNVREGETENPRGEQRRTRNAAYNLHQRDVSGRTHSASNLFIRNLESR